MSTYQRIQTPRFYIDTTNWLVSRGVATSEFACKTGGDLIDHDSGFVDEELFDMNPANQVSFSTTGAVNGSPNRGEHVLFTIDKQTAGISTNFVAILNHNMSTAQGKFRVAASASDITAADPTAVACTEVINATDSSNIFTPANDGDSIVKFVSASTLRYIAVQIEGSNSNNFNGSTPLRMACILIGAYYDMPHTPDLAVTRAVSFGNDIMETPAGKRFSGAKWLEGNASSSTQSGQPFRSKGTSTSLRFGGRMRYQMAFSYLNDSDLTNSDISTSSDTDSFYNMVWNRTGGSHLPFIFTPDKDTSTVGDYLFARFGQDEWGTQQVASNVYSTSLAIAEEF